MPTASSAEVRAFFNGLDQTNRTALLTGLCVLAVLLILPRFTRRVPAVLVAVVGVTVVSAVLDLADHGVKTVGTLPQGVPVPALPWTKWSDVGPLLVGAVGITLVSLTDTIATATSFAARRGDEVDPDQEMVGIGTSNIAAGFFQGFAVSVSGSRTAVADQSGVQDPDDRIGRRRLGRRPAPLPQRAPGRPAPDGPGRRGHHGGPVTHGSGRPSTFRRGPHIVAGREPGRHVWRHPPRGAPRDRGGDRPHRLAVLPPRMVAPRRRPRRRARPRWMAQHRQVPGSDRTAGDRRVPMGSTALLRQQWTVPRPGPEVGPRAEPGLDRPAVRGDHRHRRNGRRGAQGPGRGAQ